MGINESQNDSSLSGTGSVTERDEVQELQKFAQKDTRRIRQWRLVIFGVLLATAVAVTLTTYHFLRVEQKDAFRVAFEKFALTVSDSAQRQQKILRASFAAVSTSVSVDAIRSESSWPNYTTPYWELYAGQALNQSRAEIATIFMHVEKDERQAWNNFSEDNYLDWSRSGHMTKYGNLSRLNEIGYVPDMLKSLGGGKWAVDDGNFTEYWPMWLYSPPPAQYGAVNWNLINIPAWRNHSVITAQRVLRDSVVTDVRGSISEGTAFTKEEHNLMHSAYRAESGTDHPHSFMFIPVFEDPNDVDSKIVATIAIGFAWDFSLRGLLPRNVQGLHAVIENSCNQTYTYSISGEDALFLGDGDKHEPEFERYYIEPTSLSLLTHPLKDETLGHCQYTMHLYPSAEFAASYDHNTPEIFAVVVAITFTLVAVVFVVYDFLVKHRNDRLVQNAARSNAVVTSLFPGTLRERVLEQRGTKNKMKSFLVDGKEQHDDGDKPLADLFLETTILFADITGFTAWSSVREPSQVFTLLEAVYGNFDDIAKSRKIFKVETVGDCYVAATGIPEPRKDHASAMVLFAQECICRMSGLVKRLELTLGPGTGELGIRVGVHSGPVTAGVLRGERARFQLFGDTMNTTARMESTGQIGRIHASPETAELLKARGKEHWVEQRADLVDAKGKGKLQTYWINVSEEVVCPDTVRENRWHEKVGSDFNSTQKCRRLIDWNVEMLSRLIKQVVARQQSQNRQNSSSETFNGRPGHFDCSMPLDAVKEVIMLPEYRASGKPVSADQITLDPQVLEQLREYVTTISHLYYRNPFHNFEHASHVVMSVIKLMSRIVAPDTFHDSNQPSSSTDMAQNMHDHTYGITSDPLTQFACAFSALIHDVDHRGVPNTQLIKENEELGEHYSNRSVAEQNSFDLSWELLLDSRYDGLRATLCQTPLELQRLRELVVNGVMATDIADKELKNLRNQRWDTAFATTANAESGHDAIVNRNRKATIVIEHLLQASDVSHTMQHWHIYRQWNQHLFAEMYRAFKEGRSDKDPSEFWYQGELGFFDFYIIPLAKKLKECGVFGVSSGEYLNYAMNNRTEWEVRGRDVVAEMMAEMKSKKYGVV